MPRTLPILALVLVAAPLLAGPAPKGKPDSTPKLKAETFEGLKLRNIGPAFTSGRVGDIAIHPKQPDVWYVAAASGGLWKTLNGGITWASIFDEQPSYSIGCVSLDPRDPLTVWVGTGENNSQRSVGYGDGLYKSTDGGKTWKNVGLKTSEHLAKVLIDPRDSKVVYVASQGPLWKSGGERGLFKTTDGGHTWKAILSISEDTGITDVVMDPKNPDLLYAASYQRRRHVWSLINGGPESAIHRSTDGGQTWTKLSEGLPKEDIGRIGLAVAEGVVYATIEAANKAGGFFRSTDGGASWEKRSDQVSGSAQYYQELFVDPANSSRIYSMDTFMQVSEDAGKSWRKVGETHKHVDNHALWIDPQNPEHLIAGCDGGVYESRDRGRNWGFKANLPIAQFYRATTDNALPFYNIYAGTQDNFSMGGPSRTRNNHGILNADWFVTQGGDGFVSQVDPTDPDTVYSEAQYGDLVRFDKRTGERTDIQPQPEPGEDALRWNWDSPLLISPHQPKRLYFSAQKLFRSDDRGNTWTAVSPDLSRRLDRNNLPIMGKLWSLDAVAKHHSTSIFGNIVSLAESPKREGLLFVGTDDGLVQVSEDGGKAWRKVEKFPGVPDMTYVSCLTASPHDANTLFVAFDNHKMGDFKPYLLRSRDRGNTWQNIVANLPERGSVYTVIEDPMRKGLLFAGTEFGLFVSLDDGGSWVQLKGNVPTIAIRDLTIQAREGDLVAATFGRGILVLDDLTALREATPELLEREGVLFSVRKAERYIPATPFGARDQGAQGDDFFTAPNPPFGAVFTYHLKEGFKDLKKARQAKEKEGKANIPTWDALRAEALDQEAQALLTVKDAQGQVIRRITGPAKAGLHRVAWDLRFPAPNPVSLKPKGELAQWERPPVGALAAPGTYTVSLEVSVQGTLKPLGESRRFDLVPLGTMTLSAQAQAELQAFNLHLANLQRRAYGAQKQLEEGKARLDHLRMAWLETPGAAPELKTRVEALAVKLTHLKLELSGDELKAKYQEAQVPSILDRLERAVDACWNVTGLPTTTQRRGAELAAHGLDKLVPAIRVLEQDLKTLEVSFESVGAPWTPNRNVTPRP